MKVTYIKLQPYKYKNILCFVQFSITRRVKYFSQIEISSFQYLARRFGGLCFVNTPFLFPPNRVSSCLVIKSAKHQIISPNENSSVTVCTKYFKIVCYLRRLIFLRKVKEGRAWIPAMVSPPYSVINVVVSGYASFLPMIAISSCCYVNTRLPRS